MRIPLARILYVLLLGMGLVFLLVSRDFPGPQTPRDIGPAIFPQLLALLMIALILVDLVLSWRRTKWAPVGDLSLVIRVGILMGAVVWIATRMGFFVVLPPALFIGLWLTGSRLWIANILYSLLLPAGIWLLFSHVLQLPIGSF